jgi:hypothetical protein
VGWESHVRRGHGGLKAGGSPGIGVKGVETEQRVLVKDAWQDAGVGGVRDTKRLNMCLKALRRGRNTDVSRCLTKNNEEKSKLLYMNGRAGENETTFNGLYPFAIVVNHIGCCLMVTNHLAQPLIVATMALRTTCLLNP